MQIGAQFYTIRDFCKTLDSLDESLKRVADIGYKTIQLSRVCDYDPQWMKEKLDEYGLKCVLTHTPAGRIINETARVAKEHDVFGCRCVGLGYYEFTEAPTEETVEKFVSDYSAPAKELKERGKYFMYHNHDKEFQKVGGKPILALIAEAFPADEMGFTLDTFWVQAGGGDPADWIEKLSGRVPCIHLKDYSYGRKMAVIGEGNINFSRIFEKAESAGTEYMLVEQDDCNGEDPFDCLKRSYEYLRSRGFE